MQVGRRFSLFAFRHSLCGEALVGLAVPASCPGEKRRANSEFLTADSFLEQMRIIRTAGVDRDLFLGVPAGVPAGLYPELRKHGIGATDVVVARVVVLGPSILQLDDVVGVDRHRAEGVARGNAEPHLQKVGQIQNARKNNDDNKDALHEPGSNSPPYCESSLNGKFLRWFAFARQESRAAGTFPIPKI